LLLENVFVCRAKESAKSCRMNRRYHRGTLVLPVRQPLRNSTGTKFTMNAAQTGHLCVDSTTASGNVSQSHHPSRMTHTSLIAVTLHKLKIQHMPNCLRAKLCEKALTHLFTGRLILLFSNGDEITIK